MGNPKPVAVSGVAATPLAHHPGAWSTWYNAPIPASFDVEDFAAAFVRFENGATLILEVDWLLHHDTPGDDMQMWLYGTEGGSQWPKCEIFSSNYQTRQLYDRTLKLTADTLEPHTLECVEDSTRRGRGPPLARACRTVAPGDGNPQQHLSQPARAARGRNRGVGRGSQRKGAEGAQRRGEENT